LAVLRLLTGMGVPANRIVICHTDVAFDLPYVRRLLDEGVYVQFDNFGKEFYIDPEDRAGYSGGVFASDPERVRVIRQLVDWGYAKQLLITNDLCLKQMLRRYGGWGYAHILRHIVPMLAEHGISEETIGGFVRDNPVHWLCGQARPGCGSGPVT
jgi:phosphotriesterase-related protein